MNEEDSPQVADEPKKKKVNPETLLTEARERFQYVTDVDKENRDNQKEDTEFVYVAGKQWDDNDRRLRQDWSEPCLEFNQLGQFVDQIVNDQRQNRPGIRVHPAGNQTSQEVADIMQGMIRAIEGDSDAEAAYDSAYQNAVVGGRGYLRIISDYDKGFDQKLLIRRIPDPLTVYLDPDFALPDGADANYCFITEAIEEKEFARRYPDAEPDSFEMADSLWKDGEKVIIADYYRRVATKRTWVAMTDGNQGWKDELPEMLPPGVTIARERECEEWSVEWYKIAGGNQILETYEWPGETIPVVCVMGVETMVNGKRIYQGIVRRTRDAQRLFNYAMTSQAIRLALSPKSPWLAAEGQINGYEDMWKNANKRAYSTLVYKPTSIEGIQVGPPQRMEGGLVDAGFANMAQQMQGLLRSTTGMYEQSLGMQGQELSGRAIMAREKQGDNATFHYVDNLSRAIALVGKIIVEVMPDFYDTQRMVTIIGPDDVKSMVTINQQLPNPMNPFQPIMQKNITVGDYAVEVESGPSYATKRQETADTLTQLAQADPNLMAVAGDLIIKAQDVPDADAIADRIKVMLPAPIQQMEAAKAGGQNPQVASLNAQLQQMQQAMQQQGQQAQQMVQELQQKLQSATMALQASKADKSADIYAAQAKMADSQRQQQIDDSDNAMQTYAIKAKAQNDAAQTQIKKDALFVDFLTAVIPLLQAQGIGALPEAQQTIQAAQQSLPQ